MKKIVLISCARKKENKVAKAKDLYASPLFRLNYEYALFQDPSKVFVLSAKHGLIETEEEIGPYDLTLSKMSKRDRLAWANKVLGNLKEKCDLDEDYFVILAGEKYRGFILPELKKYVVIGKHLGIGRKLKFLKEKIELEKKCRKVHEIFNSLKRFCFPQYLRRQLWKSCLINPTTNRFLIKSEQIAQ